MSLSDQRSDQLTEKPFRLPDLGEGLTEADLLSWHVAVGDTVTLNQVIGEVETAKAAVELLSPYAGVVLELHAAEGDTIPVGNDIITFGVPAEGPASPAPAERVPNLVGYGATSGTESRRRRPVPAARQAEPPKAPSRPLAK